LFFNELPAKNINEQRKRCKFDLFFGKNIFAVKMPVQQFNFTGNSFVSALGAFQGFAYAELKIHRRTVQPNQSSAIAVNIHHAVD
jgi:hypothetical protein